jgi:phospholipid-binding lipoprotein MlaA
MGIGCRNLFLAILLLGTLFYTPGSASPQDLVPSEVPLDSSVQEDPRIEVAQATPPPGGSEGNTGSEVKTETEDTQEMIPDPLEPINRAFFQFNDKLYFWVLKPVASVYKSVLHQEIRVGIRNIFSNLVTPVRFVNCLLQANFKGAGTEVFRFVLNTGLGLGGFFDPAKKEFNIEKKEEDFGQTLGVWGLGPAIYFNWPILGPSSLRDTIGFAGDMFLDPQNYLLPSTPVKIAVRSYERVNDTSLRIGDYEDLKKEALDPYTSLKDIYSQYRLKKIKER